MAAAEGRGLLAPRPARRLESTTLHMVGIALLFTAGGIAVSAVVEVLAGGDELGALVVAAAVVVVGGAALWRGTRAVSRVSAASAFAAVSWTWIAVSLAGALPFVFAGLFPSVDDALFESISGFTATGSTVLSPIEGTSKGLLFWRQLTQWYGGMGMIVLAVAILPFLGVGGMQLMMTESPGPMSDRLAPRVQDTAKRLWVVYVALTAATAAALLLVGLDLYDAVAHALTAVATGGFSPHDASIAHFDSLAVELVLMAAMFLGAVNFALHWHAVSRRRLGMYWARSEFRLFVYVLAGATLVVTGLNIGDGMAAGRAVRDSAFNVFTTMTTCGFATADFAQWVPSAQLILVALMFSGAMAGSTSGAIKLFRVQAMVNLARRELRRVRHPRAVLPLRLGGEVVAEDVAARIAGFFVVYIVVAILGVVALAGLGSDLTTAVGGVATAMGGVGPGVGEAGPASNFLVFSRPARGVLMVLMLLGRLEIFPMLLMFAAPARSLRLRRPRRPAFSPRR